MNPIKYLILAALVSGESSVSGQVLLKEGQSPTFEFKAQSLVYSEKLFDTVFKLHFAPGTFTIGEAADVNIFPNSITDTPFRFAIISQLDPSSTNAIVGGWSWYDTESPLRFDFQCLVQITMFDGDAELEGFSLLVTKDSDFSTEYEFVPVPEPSISSLLGLAFWGLVTKPRFFIKR